VIKWWSKPEGGREREKKEVLDVANMMVG